MSKGPFFFLPAGLRSWAILFLRFLVARPAPNGYLCKIMKSVKDGYNPMNVHANRIPMSVAGKDAPKGSEP